MKYFCKLKGAISACGYGETLEKALAEFNNSDNADLVDMEWYALTPIKVMLTLVDTTTTTVKTTKKVTK